VFCFIDESIACRSSSGHVLNAEELLIAWLLIEMFSDERSRTRDTDTAVGMPIESIVFNESDGEEGIRR
jgi:hypothetical protein